MTHPLTPRTPASSARTPDARTQHVPHRAMLAVVPRTVVAAEVGALGALAVPVLGVGAFVMSGAAGESAAGAQAVTGGLVLAGLALLLQLEGRHALAARRTSAVLALAATALALACLTAPVGSVLAGARAAALGLAMVGAGLLGTATQAPLGRRTAFSLLLAGAFLAVVELATSLLARDGAGALQLRPLTASGLLLLGACALLTRGPQALAGRLPAAGDLLAGMTLAGLGSTLVLDAASLQVAAVCAPVLLLAGLATARGRAEGAWTRSVLQRARTSGGPPPHGPAAAARVRPDSTREEEPLAAVVPLFPETDAAPPAVPQRRSA